MLCIKPPKASTGTRTQDPRWSRFYAQHDLIYREAASLSRSLLNRSPAPKDKRLQCARQLAGILHANQSTTLSLGTELGAAVKAKTPAPDTSTSKLEFGFFMFKFLCSPTYPQSSHPP